MAGKIEKQAKGTGNVMFPPAAAGNLLVAAFSDSAAAPATLSSPTGIANCTLWIDPSQDSFSNNDPVGTATDRSASSLDLTQATAGAKPLFKTNVFAGSQPGYLFDGTDDLLVGSTTSNYITTTAGTVFSVVRVIDVGTDNATSYGNEAIWCEGGSGGDCGVSLRSSVARAALPNELRPTNYVKNHTIPVSGVDFDPLQGWPSWSMDDSTNRLLVDGNFAGTTDEIFQWAAAKWSIDVDLIRAVATQESWWDADTNGDDGTSYGLMQVKTSAAGLPGTDAAMTSSAYNVDLWCAWFTDVYAGKGKLWRDRPDLTTRTMTAGDLEGSLESWYTGIGPTSWSTFYSTNILAYYTSQPWLNDADFKRWATPASYEATAVAANYDGSDDYVEEVIPMGGGIAIIMWKHGSGVQSISVNGSVPKTIASGTTSSLSQPLWVGRQYTSINEFAHFYQGEMIAYNRELTTTEVTRVFNYLMTKWLGWTQATTGGNNSDATSPWLTTFYRIATGGETTGPSNFSGGGNYAWWAAEYSGLAASSVLDVTAKANSTNSAVTSQATGTTGTTTQANELAIAVVAVNGGTQTSPSWSNSYTHVAQSDGTAQDLFVGNKSLTAAATTSSTLSWTTSGRATAAVLTFKVLQQTSAVVGRLFGGSSPRVTARKRAAAAGRVIGAGAPLRRGRTVGVTGRLFGGAWLKGSVVQVGAPPVVPPVVVQITYTTPTPPADLLTHFFGSGVVRIRRRVDIYEFDGATLWMRDAPLVGGNVSVDVDRGERRMCDLVLDNNDRTLDHHPEGFWYDKIIKVIWGIETDEAIWETQLGEFMIDAIAGEHFPYTLSVKTRDYTKKLMQDKFGVATAFSALSGVADVIKIIASGNTDDPLVGVSKFNLDDGGATLAVDVVFERQTTRWDAITQVADSYGLEVFFDRFGFLVLRPYRDPVLSPTVFSFQTGIPDGNLVRFTKSSNDTRIVNHFTVTGAASETGVPAFGEASNTEPSSPTRINKIGRRSDGIDNALLTDSEACVALAELYLKVAGLESYEINMGAINAPWLDVGEAIMFIDPRPAPNEPDRYYLTTLDLPLELAPMGVTGKRVQVVGGSSGTGGSGGGGNDPGTPPPPPPPPDTFGLTVEAETGELVGSA